MQRTDLAFTHVVTGAHEHVTFHTPIFRSQQRSCKGPGCEQLPFCSAHFFKGYFRRLLF